MESGNYLGIYLSKSAATVVCLDSRSANGNVAGCFSVSVEGQEEASPHKLAGLITQGCAERGLTFSEIVVALDCAMFMQHNVHSEFNDPKRIAATVRFDTEEALATDISDIAIAFKITSRDDSGAELTIFSAQRKILSDVLGALQRSNMDPIVIEPDVSCLSRFICQKVSLPEGSHPLFVMLSGRRGYLIIPPVPAGTAKTSTVRTFLVGPTQQRGDLVAREVVVTTALIEGARPINCLRVVDSIGSVSCQMLGEKLGIETSFVDLAGSAATDPQTVAGCADQVDFAIAYGAALTCLEKTPGINFRNDFMPYQGKRLRLQKTLKFAAVSVAVFLIAVGLYFQTQLLKVNSDRSRLRAKLAKDYAAVMLGDKLPDKTSPSRKLDNELRRIKAVKSGLFSITGEESISSKLTLVLGAFNSCAAATNLEIDSISVSEKSISVDGSTSSRTNTLKLFEAVSKGGLEILQQRVSASGARDGFTITVVPKKQARAGL